MKKHNYKKGFLKNNYKLVWDELFNVQELDTNKWNIEIRRPGWVNNELQAYTNRKENLFIKNNNLFIRGIKGKHDDAHYTSGRINTSKKFNWKYGRFEIRAKIPKQKGIWPAIWLLSENIENDGWPKCGEIDIMEHINNEDIIYGTIHTDKYNHMNNNQIGGQIIIDDISSKFHIYGLEWNSECILWFLDNKVYFRLNKKDYFENVWPFDNEYFLIINQAIGGFWPGNPEDNFITSDYIIDWIKIYQ